MKIHGLLTKFLHKHKIDSADQLSSEERIIWDDWQRILSKDELTLQDIKEFCNFQVEMIETKWKDFNLEQTKKAELIPYHTVYKTLLSAIDSPKVAREALERHLIEITK